MAGCSVVVGPLSLPKVERLAKEIEMHSMYSAGDAEHSGTMKGESRAEVVWNADFADKSLWR